MSKSQKPLQSGELGVIRKDKVDSVFCVLWEDRLDFYSNANDFKNNPDLKRLRVAVSDVEEFCTLDEGFLLSLDGGKSLTVQCDPKSLRSWIEQITSLMDLEVEEGANNEVKSQSGGGAKKEDPTRPGGNETKKDAEARDGKMQSGLLGNESTREDDSEEVEVRLEAEFQLEVNGKLEQRYFWLTPHNIECFRNRTEAEDQPPLNNLALSDIAQVEKTASGFCVSCKDKKRRMVIVCDEPTSRLWIKELQQATGTRKEDLGLVLRNAPDAKTGQPVWSFGRPVVESRLATTARKEEPKIELPKVLDVKTAQPAVDLPKKVGAKVEESLELEVDVVLDEELEIEIHGSFIRKHVWLTTATFDYTETSGEDEDALESYSINEISAVERTANGFIVRHKDGIKKILIKCGASTIDKWTKELTNVMGSKRNVLLGSKKDETQEFDKRKDKESASGTRNNVKNAGAIQLAESPQRQNEPRTMTTPVWSKQGQATTPPQASKVAPPLGYPGAKNADDPGKKLDSPPKRAQPTPVSYAQSAVCKGTLGIFQSGREEQRYFALFLDAFKYWIDQSSYSRSDEPRGHVLREQIVKVAATDAGFALSFAGGNELVLVCESEREKQMWLAEWRKMLGSRVTSGLEGKESHAEAQKRVLENDRLQLNNSTPAIIRSQMNLGSMVDIAKDLLFEGSLLLVRRTKREKKYVALFKDRLDYFANAFDMKSGKNPRGRVWFHDIRSIEIEGCNFTVSLENVNLPNMVLIAEPNDSQSWIRAWTKGGVKCVGPSPSEQKTIRSVSPSPARTTPQKAPSSPLQEPLIHGAMIEGQFQITRITKGKAGVPTIRHFVLFPDRLDYFSDSLMARGGRALESFQTKDIEWIDVVDGGFEITVARRPYKLKELQGLLPQWIDALLGLFGQHENDYLRRS